MQQVKTQRCFSTVGSGLGTLLVQGAELLAECLGDAGLLWAQLLPHRCYSSHPSQCFAWALAWHNPSALALLSASRRCCIGHQ